VLLCGTIWDTYMIQVFGIHIGDYLGSVFVSIWDTYFLFGIRCCNQLDRVYGTIWVCIYNNLYRVFGSIW
jgi:hypothetical protein